MKTPTLAATKLTFSSLALGAALFAVGVPAASASTLTLNLSSIATGSSLTDAGIAFDGASHFEFVNSSAGPGAGYGFTLATSTGAVLGKVDGKYTFGAVAPFGVTQVAPVVSGVGQVSIFDGSKYFTATLTFDTISTTTLGDNTYGGVVEVATTANLSNFTYDGGNTDLYRLFNAGSASEVISFQFGSKTQKLSYLKNHAGSTSYSGTITAVPVPAAAWLFGSALVGMAGVGRSKRQGRKEEVAA